LDRHGRINNRSLAAIVVLLLSAGSARAQTTESLIDRAIANRDFTWQSVAADGVRVYYQPGSFAERHRVMLLRSAKAAMDTGLEFLGGKRDARELRVIYVDSRAQMETLIGRPYTGLAVRDGHGVLLVCNPEWRSFDTHEIAHILTYGRWGDPIEASAWMLEGLPNAVDGLCQTSDMDRIAAYLLAADRWPGLSEFTKNAASLGEIPVAAFGASFLRYLRGKYGTAILEECWRSGLSAALAKRNIAPKQVEKDWLDTLRDRDDPLTDAEWKKIDTDGCG
jgi:hypothetical protein